MRIIILNTSGNVAKSTMAREVFYVNMDDDYKFFEIESLNSSHEDYDVNIKKLTTIKQLSIQIIKEKKIVLDLGNSEVFKTLVDLSEYKYLDRFDKFVVPFIPDKAWKDTNLMIQSLITDYNIDSKKIYLIPTRYDKKTMKFDKFITSAEKLGINFNMEYGIWTSDIISLTFEQKCMVRDLINDDIDYEELIANADNELEQDRLWELMIGQKPIKDFQQHLLNIKNYIVR